MRARFVARPLPLARCLAICALLAGALSAGCTPPTPAATGQATQQPAPKSAPSDTTNPAGYAGGQQIVFDMGHSEVFGPDDTSPLGQSQAITRMREAGFELTVNSDTITAEDLSGASGLFLAGPMKPLLDEEYEAINAFVERGGVLVLTIHVPYPVMSVPGHWSLPTIPAILVAEQPLQEGGDPGVLLAPEIAADSLTEGVKSVLVVNGWPIRSASDSSKLVVSTATNTWADADADKTVDAEEIGSYGVIGSAGLGKGRVIVSGDDAIFANIALGEADNLRLLDNILQMMAKGLES